MMQFSAIIVGSKASGSSQSVDEARSFGSYQTPSIKQLVMQFQQTGVVGLGGPVGNAKIPPPPLVLISNSNKKARAVLKYQ